MNTEFPEFLTETTLVDFLPSYSALYFEFYADIDLTQFIYINFLVPGI